MATGICILAVDFPLFPRRFAKTSLFGYSLMDCGVGMFVVANALVAPEARNTAANGRMPWAYFPKSILHAVPLVVLGLIRIVALHLTGYRNIVTEYGIQWNFFFTLAVIKVMLE